MAAQGGKVGDGNVEVAGTVVAVCLFVVGGQGQAVNAGRQRVGTAFTDAGDEQDGCRQRRLTEGAGRGPWCRVSRGRCGGLGSLCFGRRVFSQRGLWQMFGEWFLTVRFIFGLIGFRYD